MNKQTSKTTLEATNDIKIAEEIIERVISLEDKVIIQKKGQPAANFHDEHSSLHKIYLEAIGLFGEIIEPEDAEHQRKDFF